MNNNEFEQGDKVKLLNTPNAYDEWIKNDNIHPDRPYTIEKIFNCPTTKKQFISLLGTDYYHWSYKFQKI